MANLPRFDDFSTVSTLAGNEKWPNPQKWGVFNSLNPLGRTRFGLDPLRRPNPPSSAISYARFQLRPSCCWVKNPPGYIPVFQRSLGMFQGTEIESKRLFHRPAKGEHFEFSASIRLTQVPKGAIAGFFVFAGPSPIQDEIDIESLGNLLPRKQLWLNSWNEGKQLPSPAHTVSGVNFTKFNTYTIKWYRDKVEHWVKDLQRGPTIINSNHVPDEPMQLYLNIWAPNNTGDDAFPQAHSSHLDSFLNPKNKKRNQTVWYFDVDWVSVRKQLRNGTWFNVM